MEYMAEQMDRQIEGAQNENERLRAENERLRMEARKKRVPAATAVAWQFRDESWPHDEWVQITREQYEHMAAGNVTGDRGEHWDIRELYDLWEIAVPGWVVDALDTANAMLTAQGYAHTDLRAARDLLADRILTHNTR